MVFRLRHKSAQKKDKKDIVKNKSIPERQGLEQILDNENANIESIRVSYDYEPAAELAPAINKTLQIESTKSLVKKAANDTFLTGAVAGIVGTLVLHILSLIWMNLGFINTTTMQVSGEIFLTPSQINTMTGFVVSIFVHFVVGSVGGVLLAYFMKYAGYDFYWIKGLALAGFMLMMGMGLVVDMMGIVPQMRHNAVGVLFHIVSYIAYGLVVAYILYKFAGIRNKFS